MEFASAPGSACWTASRWSSSKTAMIRRARREVLADLVVHLRLEPVVDELPDEATRRGACGRGRQERRSGEADEEADSPSPLDTLAAAVVRRLADVHRAVLVVRDQDRRLELHPLVGDEPGEGVELLRGGVDVPVARDQDVGCLGHLSPFVSRSALSQRQQIAPRPPAHRP
jgi:hypothetical protein